MNMLCQYSSWNKCNMQSMQEMQWRNFFRNFLQNKPSNIRGLPLDKKKYTCLSMKQAGNDKATESNSPHVPDKQLTRSKKAPVLRLQKAALACNIIYFSFFFAQHICATALQLK